MHQRPSRRFHGSRQSRRAPAGRPRRLAALLAAAAVLSASPAAALNPPPAINSLAVGAIVSTGLGASSMTVTLTWTAPSDGDGGNLAGGAFAIRWSTLAAIANDAQFDAAAFSLNIATTAAAGALQSVSVPFLSADASHYFAIKSTDSEGLTSTLSNAAVAKNYILYVPYVLPASNTHTSTAGRKMMAEM